MFGSSTGHIIHHIAIASAKQLTVESLTNLMNEWQFIKIFPTNLFLSLNVFLCNIRLICHSFALQNFVHAPFRGPLFHGTDRTKFTHYSSERTGRLDIT